MSEWMLRRGRRPPVGPVTTERLIRAIKVGRVPPDTEACRVGSEEWQPYSRFPELELALDSNDVTERPSEGPPLPLDSERAGPNTARSPGTDGASAARLSSPQASPGPVQGDDEDDDDAATQVVKTPFFAPEPEPRSAPRPAAGVPPPKPAGWSSRPAPPPSQPTVRATPGATAAAPPRPEPRPAGAVPRPAAGAAAAPRPMPSRLSSPIAIPPPAPSSPRAALSRPSTPGVLPPPPLSSPFAAPKPAASAPNASLGNQREEDEVDDDAMTHVVASPIDMPTNRPPGLKPRDSASDASDAALPQAQPGPVVAEGAYPPHAGTTPLPVAPVMIAPPEATGVRTPPPPIPIPSYPPAPVLDATTKALIALIVVLSIGLTIVLFLLWRRS